MTGSTAGNMKLEAYDRDNKLVCKLDDNNALLGSYPIDDGMIIHVSLCFRMLCISDNSNMNKWWFWRRKRQQALLYFLNVKRLKYRMHNGLQQCTLKEITLFVFWSNIWNKINCFYYWYYR